MSVVAPSIHVKFIPDSTLEPKVVGQLQPAKNTQTPSNKTTSASKEIFAEMQKARRNKNEKENNIEAQAKIVNSQKPTPMAPVVKPLTLSDCFNHILPFIPPFYRAEYTRP